MATGSYDIDMRTVGIKVLKNKLSEYVRLAASGEVVLVTERERVVAELCPPRLDRAPRLHDAWLAEAVRKGWVTPPMIVGISLPPRKTVAPLSHLLVAVSRDRAER